MHTIQPQQVLHKYYQHDGKPQFYRVQRDFVSTKHLHQEVEITYVLHGTVDVLVSDTLFPMHEKEMLLIPANVIHYYRQTDSSANILNVKFIENWVAPAFVSTHELDALQTLLRSISKIHASDSTCKIIKTMQSCTDPNFLDLFYFGHIILLLTYLLQHPEIIEYHKPISSENIRYIQNALKFIQDHGEEHLSLRMLANHIGLTESYCSKYFKDNIGISFVEYVNTRRISNAERLLRYTSLNITEIAAKSGFSSIQTFNRVFKNVTGMSPTQYRGR